MSVNFFTFGLGHELEGHCQPIKANNPAEAREKMVDMHGTIWAFQYSEEEYLKQRQLGQSNEVVLEPVILKGGEN